MSLNLAIPSFNLIPSSIDFLILVVKIPKVRTIYSLSYPLDGCIQLLAIVPSVVKSSKPEVLISNLPIDIHLWLSNFGSAEKVVFLDFGSYLEQISPSGLLYIRC